MFGEILANPIFIAIALLVSLGLYVAGRAIAKEDEALEVLWLSLPLRGLGAISAIFFIARFVKWAWSL